MPIAAERTCVEVRAIEDLHGLLAVLHDVPERVLELFWRHGTLYVGIALNFWGRHLETRWRNSESPCARGGGLYSSWATQAQEGMLALLMPYMCRAGA